MLEIQVVKVMTAFVQFHIHGRGFDAVRQPLPSKRNVIPAGKVIEGSLFVGILRKRLTFVIVKKDGEQIVPYKEVRMKNRDDYYPFDVSCDLIHGGLGTGC